MMDCLTPLPPSRVGKGEQSRNNNRESVIEVWDVTVAYHRAAAIEGITVAFPARAVTGIIGPNGAGKTTLLHTIMGMQPHQRGSVTLFGTTIRQARRRIAYVPQREAVDWQFPVTVRDVVLMGRYAAIGFGRRPSAADEVCVHDALARVGMAAFAARQIGTLSGGQQQRVFLARALAQEAELLILDEPFAGIDAASQETIFHLLGAFRDSGRTVLLSTHDLTSIRSHCDYLLCLNRTVIAFGPVETTFRLDVLERTYGGRLFHLHGTEAVMLP
jgi:manganese/zinc/iron transport system ATP- binding protein